LALVFVHLKREYPLIDEFDHLLLDIYISIDYSKVAKLVFRNIQAINGENPLHIVKAAMTRWLSHFKATEWILGKYQHLLDTFDGC
jgi:hypothetical protein